LSVAIQTYPSASALFNLLFGRFNRIPGLTGQPFAGSKFWTALGKLSNYPEELAELAQAVANLQEELPYLIENELLRVDEFLGNTIERGRKGIHQFQLRIGETEMRIGRQLFEIEREVIRSGGRGIFY